MNLLNKQSSVLLLCVAILCSALQSCEPEADLMRHFVVRKGEHYSTPRVTESLQSNTLEFYARFDESAIYTFSDKGFQDSKNKLLGFADCNSVHHENSARFAWQWFDNRLEIWAYCYVNGQRVENFLGTVEIGELNYFKITLTDNSYVFQLKDEPVVEIERGDVCDKGLYYMLWPYFGGTLPAPHDVHIGVRIM